MTDEEKELLELLIDTGRRRDLYNYIEKLLYNARIDERNQVYNEPKETI